MFHRFGWEDILKERLSALPLAQRIGGASGATRIQSGYHFRPPNNSITRYHSYYRTGLIPRYSHQKLAGSDLPIRKCTRILASSEHMQEKSLGPLQASCEKKKRHVR